MRCWIWRLSWRTDLGITCDSTTAHLAAALGIEVWVALSIASDWRWLRDSDDSPWYPKMRLFRQAQWGDWSEVFQRIASSWPANPHRHGDDANLIYPQAAIRVSGRFSWPPLSKPFKWHWPISKQASYVRRNTLYRQVLQAEPRHEGVRHLLGLPEIQRGRLRLGHTMDHSSHSIKWFPRGLSCKLGRSISPTWNAARSPSQRRTGITDQTRFCRGTLQPGLDIASQQSPG